MVVFVFWCIGGLCVVVSVMSGVACGVTLTQNGKHDVTSVNHLLLALAVGSLAVLCGMITGVQGG